MTLRNRSLTRWNRQDWPCPEIEEFSHILRWGREPLGTIRWASQGLDTRLMEVHPLIWHLLKCKALETMRLQTSNLWTQLVIVHLKAEKQPLLSSIQQNKVIRSYRRQIAAALLSSNQRTSLRHLFILLRTKLVWILATAWGHCLVSLPVKRSTISERFTQRRMESTVMWVMLISTRARRWSKSIKKKAAAIMATQQMKNQAISSCVALMALMTPIFHR